MPALLSTLQRRSGVIIRMLVTGLILGGLGGGILGAVFGTLIALIIGTIAGALVGAPVGASLGLVNGAVSAIITLLFFDPLWDEYAYTFWIQLSSIPVTFFCALLGFAAARAGWGELLVPQMLQFNLFVHVPALLACVPAPFIAVKSVAWYVDRAPRTARDPAHARRQEQRLGALGALILGSILAWFYWQHALFFYHGTPGRNLIVFEQQHGRAATFLGRVDPDGTHQARLTYHFDTSLFNFTLGQRQLQRGIDNQGVVYLSDHDRDWQTNRDDNFYNLRLDGSAVQPINHRNPWVSYAALSPDGTWIVGMTMDDKVRRVVVRTIDGRSEWCLTCSIQGDLASDFAWSPDGKRVAFSMRVGQQSQLFVAAWDGSTIEQITRDPVHASFQPDWLPDGTRLAFTRSGEQQNTVAVIDPTSGALTILTTSGMDGDPSWSPDGTQIAFVSGRDGKRTQNNDQMFPSRHHIYRMNADGSNQQRLTLGLDDYTNPVWTRVPLQ